MASIQEMIEKSAAAAGTTSTTASTTESAAASAPTGITIERQDIEHVRGQAKSGL